ncbi:MAG: LLM class flavin-dependent oxidoreductase [Actinomycetota bacterium]|nr:MAG: LLM class flavin-dependent oxidoreductase [Actinomycetota bacterium]
MPDVPLSALDLATVGEGSSTTAALHATLQLARLTEQLGYRRFWVAEHHNMPGIASAAPTVLMAAIAAATETIRVGSGGIMLPNHAPLAVAEQIGTLAGLHPDRIDLGIGRAPGTDPATALALRGPGADLGADDFPQHLAETMAFLDGGFPPGHPYAAIHCSPTPSQPPPVWLLGSSGFSAQLAGQLGLPFAFAHHFSAVNTVPALQLYRRSFQPSAQLAEPYAMVAVQVIVADDDERAHWLAGPAALSFLRLRRGRPGRLPTPEEAAAYPWTTAELGAAAQRREGQAIGSPATVAAALSDLIAATGADEIMATTMVHDPADRRRSFELLAGLRRPATDPATEAPAADTAGAASVSGPAARGRAAR